MPVSDYPGANRFTFGDSAALNAEILALVRAGQKTVTCDALAAFAARGEALPQVGRTDIALGWDGTPALALKTVQVTHVPLDQVGEELVADMGEFTDAADFRKGYGAYLTRSGHFAPDALMLIERFTVVEDFAGEGAT